MNRTGVIKVLGIAGLIVVILINTGCAGTSKTYDATTGKKISSIPAGVAVVQAAAVQMKECPDNPSYIMSADDITKLSASAQAEAVRNIPTMMLLGMLQKQNGGGDCYTAIAKETQAFFTAQAVKYQQWGMVGKVGAIGAATYFTVDSIVSAVAAAGAVGDTSIGTVNVSGSSAGGAGGGEGVAGTGGNVSMNTNIGNGSLNNASERGIMNFGEKPINGNDNELQDNDSPNTNASIF